MIRRLYRLWPHPRLLARLWLLTGCQAVLQGLLLGLLVPILGALVRPEPDLGAVTGWLVLGAVGVVLHGVLAVIADPVGYRAAGTLAAQLRRDLMHRVSTLPLGWFTAENRARLARLVTADVGDTAHLAVTVARTTIASVLLPVTVVAVSAVIDWRMAVLLSLIAVPARWALRRAGRVAESAEIELERASAAVAGRAVELGQAQAVLRAAGHTTATPRMAAALAEHRNSYREGMRRARRPFFVYTGVIAGGFVVVLTFVAALALDGRVTPVEAIVLLVMATRFLESLGEITDLVGALRALTNKIGRIEELLETPTLPSPSDPVRRLDQTDIEFHDVTFTYPGGVSPALESVSLRCSPGTTTALVGASGSGKTTVTRLVARFFDVNAGRVCIGGVDVRDLDPAVLLDEVAVVFQDVYLFDDTIEDNVLLARPDATRDELDEAARAARLDEVIDRLPGGWYTRVGEGGARLSGGERQRVAIARAILKRAGIVLVDEASSALDPENDAAVTRAIAALGDDPQRTVIVIAHRPATLDGADQVVALDSGRVVETGVPVDLLGAGGTVARLAAQYERARHWRIDAGGAR